MLFLLNSNSTRSYIKGSFLCAVFFTALLMFASCSDNESKRKEIVYDKILDTTNHIFDGGNPLKATRYLDSATAQQKFLSLKQKFANYEIHYNYFYHTRKNKDKAMLYADSMLNVMSSKKDQQQYPTEYGRANFDKGDLYFDEGKYSDAYQYYYQGKVAGNFSPKNCTLADYTYRMGMIMYKQEHYRLAAAWFKQSSAQTGNCEWNFRIFYRQQELLSNTGLSYSELDERDSALMFYNKALKYIDSLGGQFNVKPNVLDVARAVVNGNKADIYISEQDYKRATSLLQKSIKVNMRKGNDNADAQLSELRLARIYSRENKSDSLIRLLNIIHGQFDTIKSQKSESDWNMLMAGYYIQKNEAKPAYDYLVRYNALKDSINNRDKMLKEADVTQQMKRLEKNYEYTQLMEHSKLQHLYLSIAVVFGIMLLLIISLILSNWRKSRKNIKVLDGLNKKIRDQTQNLQYALTELNASGLEKDRILRTVAHDLRNPLGGVASLAGLMVADSDYTYEQKELISLIKDTSNNSIELINEILDATENNQAKANKDRELIEINALLNHCVELLRFKAAEKNQQIILEMIETPVELFILREKIWRVFSNLISNAIKFSRPNSLIYISVTDAGKKVIVAVKDNGIGIPEDIKDRIFNMFTDAKRAGTAGEKSFGLGLSICKQIVENHHGKIWFESDVNNGTTFFVALGKQDKSS
jgi:signal transduction histidine kinase